MNNTPHIVVGVDGSAESENALRWAAQIATGLGATLQVVGVWEYPTAPGWGPGPIPIDWRPRVETEKTIVTTVDATFGPQRPLGLTISIREGNPALQLLEASAGAVMLVVGSRGHGGFAGLLLGAVSANVAEHAGCPVLVVHGSDGPPAVAA